MKRSLGQSRNPMAGYTILEILIVLGIVALIGAVVAPRLIGYLGQAKSQTAEMQIDNLRSAVKFFQIDTGRYPSDSEGLKALVERPSGLTDWAGPYLESDAALTDPWDRPYEYSLKERDAGFQILTKGRDGQTGGEDEDRDIAK